MNYNGKKGGLHTSYNLPFQCGSPTSTPPTWFCPPPALRYNQHVALPRAPHHHGIHARVWGSSGLIHLMFVRCLEDNHA